MEAGRRQHRNITLGEGALAILARQQNASRYVEELILGARADWLAALSVLDGLGVSPEDVATKARELSDYIERPGLDSAPAALALLRRELARGNDELRTRLDAMAEAQLARKPGAR